MQCCDFVYEETVKEDRLSNLDTSLNLMSVCMSEPCFRGLQNIKWQIEKLTVLLWSLHRFPHHQTVTADKIEKHANNKLGGVFCTTVAYYPLTSKRKEKRNVLTFITIARGWKGFESLLAVRVQVIQRSGWLNRQMRKLLKDCPELHQVSLHDAQEEYSNKAPSIWC